MDTSAPIPATPPRRKRGKIRIHRTIPAAWTETNNSPRADNPAVVFGGSLSNTPQTYAVGATSSAQTDDPAATRRTGLAVDILA
jgi:hypothetical protein